VTEPVTANVTTPVAGTVSIASATSTAPPATGYGLVGLAVDITAPTATAANPLAFEFRIDSTAIPAGDNATTIQLFRNGTLVPNCTGPAGTAAPDPCISVRQTLADGDIQLKALTSAASRWSTGVPAPTLGAISTPDGVVPITTAAASVSATLTDKGALAGILKVWAWGDGTTSTGTIPAGASGSATVLGSHTYSVPGVYTVTLTVTDPSQQTARATYLYIVAYDPDGPFATGGGTIVPGGLTSDPGDTLPGLNGTAKANFGFVVKYKNGQSTVPGGNLTFNYAMGDFKLSSAGFDYLVVTNQNWAKFSGLATIEGRSGLFPFRVDARDDGTTNDRFIIKVWAPGANPDTATPIYKASGDVQGEVTIHKK
jgi:PKD repeat protein